MNVRSASDIRHTIRSEGLVRIDHIEPRLVTLRRHDRLPAPREGGMICVTRVTSLSAWFCEELSSRERCMVYRSNSEEQ
jgi:hypothetical protein